MIQLEKDEEVQVVVRKHWIVLLLETFFLLFFVLVPAIVLGVLAMIDIPIDLSVGGSMSALLLFFFFIWLLFVWEFFFLIWTDYYLDILIVTNKQVVDIEQKGLFSRELSTFRLDRIQDVTAEVDGIIQTFFDYGTIHIQTAGEDREFIMKGVPAPFKIKETISKHHDAAMERLRTMSISDESLERMQDMYERDEEQEGNDEIETNK